jgi:hypothetical protein
MDTLYIGDRQLELLRQEALGGKYPRRHPQNDPQNYLGSCFVDCCISEVRKVAIPEKVFRHGAEHNGALCDIVGAVIPSTQLFIINGPRPEFKRRDNMKLQRRWKIVKSGDTEFYWNSTCDHFHSDQDNEIIDDMDHPRQMEEIG